MNQFFPIKIIIISSQIKTNMLFKINDEEKKEGYVIAKYSRLKELLVTFMKEIKSSLLQFNQKCM